MAKRDDVARLAGVSTATVTRVTNGRGSVAPETKKRIMEVIEQLNYKPNPLAQNLRMKKSNAIAVFVEDLCNPYIAECMEFMAKEAKRCGHIVMLFMISLQNRQEVVNEVLENNVMGIINLALVDVGKESKEKLVERGIKTINISEISGLSVKIDYEPPMREVYRILQAKGKCRPVFVGGMMKEWMSGDNRITSFLKLNKEFGMHGDSDSVVYGKYPLVR